MGSTHTHTQRYYAKKKKERVGDLSISRRGDNAAIVRERHELGLENIVAMARIERELDGGSIPIPEYNLPVIRTRHKDISIGIEAYSVDTTLMLLELLVETKSV